MAFVLLAQASSGSWRPKPANARGDVRNVALNRMALEKTCFLPASSSANAMARSTSEMSMQIAT
eukprot:3025294-Lingulodinium_polyedra.AAC.1